MANFFSYLFQPPRRCRWCGNNKIDRMPTRGTFEVLLVPILRLHVFSCHECLARFYSWRKFRSGSHRAEAARIMEKAPRSGRALWKKDCPSCGSADVWRSHRKSMGERMASRFLRLWPVRCHNCGHRFHRFSLRPPRKQSDKNHTSKDHGAAVAATAPAADIAQKR